MKSSLRALYSALGCAALALGPGQAIAGGEWDNGGKNDDGWDKGHDDLDVRDLRACFDSDKNQLRVKFQLRDDDWYNKHRGDYDDELDVFVRVREGEATCEHPGRGRGRGRGNKNQSVSLDGLCLDETACRIKDSRYEAIFDLDDYKICKGNRDICSSDIDEISVRIEGEDECDVRVKACDSHW